MVLWTEAAPALLAEHPFGMGYTATTYDDIARHAPRLKEPLNHLHNNPLQIAVELGWAGLAVWLVWMGIALWILIDVCRGPAGNDPATAWLAVGALGAFCGLLGVGMVEYNFGSSQIIIMYSVLLGISWALRRPGRGQAGRLSHR